MQERNTNLKALADFIDTNRANINGWSERMGPDFRAQGFPDDEITILSLTFSIKQRLEALTKIDPEREILEKLQGEVKNTDLYRSVLERMIGIKK